MFNSHELRLLRLSRQMKQEEIARKLKISKQRYSVLENHNNLKAEKINEILKAMGYTSESAKNYLAAIPPEIKT